MNKQQNQRRPTAMAVTKRAHLDRLIPGDAFQLSFDKGDRMGTFVRYEQSEGGKISVLFQSQANRANIIRVRIDPDNIYFSGAKYVGAAEALVRRVEESDVTEYSPSHPEYKSKLKLLDITHGFQRNPPIEED
jgi:hypothetical protein